MSEETTIMAHSEVAARNSKVAVDAVQDLEVKLLDRIDKLEHLVANLNNQCIQLQQKYNLLLTARFNGGSTSTES